MQLEIATQASVWRAGLTIYNSNSSGHQLPSEACRPPRSGHSLAPRQAERTLAEDSREAAESDCKVFPASVGLGFLSKIKFLGRNPGMSPGEAALLGFSRELP